MSGSKTLYRSIVFLAGILAVASRVEAQPLDAEVAASLPRAREFQVRQPYLVIPIKNGAPACELTLSIEGMPVRRYEIELADSPADVDWYAFFSLDAYQGQSATVAVARATEPGFALIRQAAQVPGSEAWYREPLRPQLRFSQRVGWNNDPNGMIYHDGEWHLFFQHNPVGWRWGNMTWGHAISRDLVHWEQQPNKLFPRTMARGACFSGGGIIDSRNSSEFKTGQRDPMILFLTDTEAGESLAFSHDAGRSFTWYAGNPVVQHTGRDPKVIWYAYDADQPPLNEDARSLGGHWVMAVYDEDQGRRQIAIYTSTNLTQWHRESEIDGFFECPELFALAVDRDAKRRRWVLSAADGEYQLGDFDGQVFTAEHAGKYRLFHGSYYAAQTFSHAPQGRRVQMGWVRIDFPGMPFNQTFSFPHELSLRTTAEGVRLFAEPVSEIRQLYRRSQRAADQEITPELPVVWATSGELFHLRATFEVRQATAVGLELGGEQIRYDVGSQQLDGVSLPLAGGRVTMEAIVDRPVMEVIGNQGAMFHTRARVQRGEVPRVRAFSEGGTARLLSAEIHELNSIWKSADELPAQQAAPEERP